jgi:hypothetical protein
MVKSWVWSPVTGETPAVIVTDMALPTLMSWAWLIVKEWVWPRLEEVVIERPDAGDPPNGSSVSHQRPSFDEGINRHPQSYEIRAKA